MKRINKDEIDRKISDISNKLDNHEYAKTEEALNNLIKKEFLSLNTNQDKINQLNYKITMVHDLMSKDKEFLNLKKELVFYENYRNISKLIDEDSKYVHVNDYIKQFIKANPELLTK